MRIYTNILEYGAQSCAKELQTACIQAAIDACRDAGGGEVVIPEGTWNTASLRLYSNITLHLLSGAELVGSQNKNDYTFYHVPTSLAYTTDPHFIELWHLPPHYLNAVITAVSADCVAVIGDKGSKINGSDCFDPEGEEGFRGPMGMVFCKCTNVTLGGYHFTNSANWSHQLDSCQNVTINDITVTGGHDGFNVHHCINVSVEGCDLQTGDDCIAGYDIHNLHMKNCRLNTSCNSLRVGGCNLLIENCCFYGPGIYPHRISGRHNTLYAFEYYSHQADPQQDDSGTWLIRNCTFKGLDSLIHYDFGDETHLQVVKPLHDVTFENVKIHGVKFPSDFKGNGNPCRLTFRDSDISTDKSFDGAAFLRTDASSVPMIERVTYSGGGAMIQAPGIAADPDMIPAQ